MQILFQILLFFIFLETQKQLLGKINYSPKLHQFSSDESERDFDSVV